MASDINQSLNLKISSWLVRRWLNYINLFGRISRKKNPLLSKEEKAIIFWKNMFWSDETKIKRIGLDDRTFVHRHKCQEWSCHKTVNTEVEALWWGVHFLGKMHGFQYLDIHKPLMPCQLNMDICRIMTPKHSPKLVKKYWFCAENIEVLEWPARSPDFQSNEEPLWNVVKAQTALKKTTKTWTNCGPLHYRKLGMKYHIPNGCANTNVLNVCACQTINKWNFNTIFIIFQIMPFLCPVHWFYYI